MKREDTVTQDNLWYQNRIFKAGLVLAIILQLSVLAVEYLGSVWPIWTGTPIMLKTQPYDPRSLFRGNFVRLNYDINRIETAQSSEYKIGSIVYVALVEEQGHWVFNTLSRTEPKTGLFLRGRVRSNYGNYLSIEYGIEALFLPKEKALLAQEVLREGTLIRIYVAANGRARPEALIELDEY